MAATLRHDQERGDHSGERDGERKPGERQRTVAGGEPDNRDDGGCCERQDEQPGSR